MVLQINVLGRFDIFLIGLVSQVLQQHMFRSRSITWTQQFTALFNPLVGTIKFFHSFLGKRCFFLCPLEILKLDFSIHVFGFWALQDNKRSANDPRGWSTMDSRVWLSLQIYVWFVNGNRSDFPLHTTNEQVLNKCLVKMATLGDGNPANESSHITRQNNDFQMLGEITSLLTLNSKKHVLVTIVQHFVF